jgi:hypothetical protein
LTWVADELEKSKKITVSLLMVSVYLRGRLIKLAHGVGTEQGSISLVEEGLVRSNVLSDTSQSTQLQIWPAKSGVRVPVGHLCPLLCQVVQEEDRKGRLSDARGATQDDRKVVSKSLELLQHHAVALPN